jgi:thermitase
MRWQKSKGGLVPKIFQKMLFCFIGLVSVTAVADDLLVKVEKSQLESFANELADSSSTKVQVLSEDWIRIQGPSLQQVQMLQASNSAILYVQPNYKLKIYNHLNLASLQQKMFAAWPQFALPLGDDWGQFLPPRAADNPDFPKSFSQTTGADPMLSQQWGMTDMGMNQAWSVQRGNQKMVVAVIDTGVDYTHEDLVQNMWRNPGETGLDSNGRDKTTNGVDDDGNGFIDDVVGWDFAANDNKPFDLAYADPISLVFLGKNPGHGTHCAGNVAARGDNGKGISGVAPNVSIMAIRFLTENGQGTTADAIKAVRYAVQNGAKVLSNSWGSSGEDPSEGAANKALRDAVQFAMDRDVLFIAAAGNGDQMGMGYDNDSSKVPAYPASYDHENIISVAALDSKGARGQFSNWGSRTVDVGAPGVKVYSTVPGNGYEDTVINYPQFGLVATWDGTSMATPHVAGAAALYWSQHPNKNFREVKQAILNSSVKVNSMSGKSVSGGKVNAASLMKF